MSHLKRKAWNGRKPELGTQNWELRTFPVMLPISRMFKFGTYSDPRRTEGLFGSCDTRTRNLDSGCMRQPAPLSTTPPPAHVGRLIGTNPHHYSFIDFSLLDSEGMQWFGSSRDHRQYSFYNSSARKALSLTVTSCLKNPNNKGTAMVNSKFFRQQCRAKTNFLPTWASALNIVFYSVLISEETVL